MNREDIIKMAREAGMPIGKVFVGAELVECVTVELERFAQLVAAAEREACAKVCESFSNHVSDRHDEMADDRNNKPFLYMSGKELGARACAELIRARGERQ